MGTTVATDFAPQRPRFVRERAEPDGYLLEPEWAGTRALVHVGRVGEPRFVGYAGPVDGPRELYDAIVAEARCETAVIDGVLVHEWLDEADLEADAEGNAFQRVPHGRQVFAAFDLLAVDGELLLEVPLLERKRHLEGLLRPSPNVRLTTFVTRSLRTWHDTLQVQGFRRVVLKAWNSTYKPGQVTDDWIVVEKLRPSREEMRKRT